MDASTAAAWWGAATGTLALGWEVYRHASSGPRLEVNVSPDMQLVIPGRGLDSTLHVSVSVVNAGDAPTTITHLCGVFYRGWIQRTFKRRGQVFVLTTDAPIPTVLPPGQTWSALVPQEQLFISAGEKAAIYLGVKHAISGNPVMVKVSRPRGNG